MFVAFDVQKQTVLLREKMDSNHGLAVTRRLTRAHLTTHAAVTRRNEVCEYIPVNTRICVHDNFFFICLNLLLEIEPSSIIIITIIIINRLIIITYYNKEDSDLH